MRRLNSCIVFKPYFEGQSSHVVLMKLRVHRGNQLLDFGSVEEMEDVMALRPFELETAGSPLMCWRSPALHLALLSGLLACTPQCLGPLKC